MDAPRKFGTQATVFCCGLSGTADPDVTPPWAPWFRKVSTWALLFACSYWHSVQAKACKGGLIEGS